MLQYATINVIKYVIARFILDIVYYLD